MYLCIDVLLTLIGLAEIFALKRPGVTWREAETKLNALKAAFDTEGTGLEHQWWLKHWHTDITGAVNPPFLSVLRAGTLPSPREEPALNSDTHWVDLAQAYASLPTELQQLIEHVGSVLLPPLLRSRCQSLIFWVTFSN